MTIDWQILLAITTVMTGLYTAYSTRQKASSEVFAAAMDAAKEALEIRDKDIARLRIESDQSRERIDHLVQYTEYLSTWIRKHYLGDMLPQTYEEYLIQQSTLKKK